MTQLLVPIVVTIVCLVNLCKGDTCTSTSSGSMDEGMATAKACANDVNTICKKVGSKPLPATFVTAANKCLTTYIQPCLQQKAPKIWAMVNKCVHNLGILTAKGLCNSATQQKVISCAESQFEANEQVVMSTAMDNMGLICAKGKLFEKCFHAAALKVK